MGKNEENKIRGERREHFRRAGRPGGKRVDLGYRRSDGNLSAAMASAVTLWLHGTVQWVETDTPTAAPGMGIHFAPLDVDSVRKLRDYLSRLS